MNFIPGFIAPAIGGFWAVWEWTGQPTRVNFYPYRDFRHP